MSFKKKSELIRLNRSTAYYRLNDPRKKTKEAEDLKIKDEIENIQFEFPYYGYRNIAAEFRNKGLKINKKKIQRIMRKYGLMSQIKRLFKSFTNSQHNLAKYPNLIKNMLIIGINQVWGADITYVRLNRSFVYVAAVIDFFSRKIKGWSISRNLDHNLILKALNAALEGNPAPAIHHSDQGVQYCSLEYTARLKENNIKISMSDKANPYQNSIIESFFKTLKYNEVYLNEYESFEEAEANIKTFIEKVYNTKRLHSSLGYLPPEEFEKQFIKIKKGRNIKNLIQYQADPLLISAKSC